MQSEFAGNISTIVEPGHIFVIGGRTVDGAARLDVNLKCGKHEESDIALHLSARFHEDIVVRNSKQDGAWGDEEREENIDEASAPNPLHSGDAFKVYILVTDNKFYVSLNERPFCTFDIRVPLNEIRAITVDKDVMLITQVDHRCVFPSPWPLTQIDRPYSFSNDVPRRFTAGHVIVIVAIPSGNKRGQFQIRFTEGEKSKQALHFNPRFHPTNIVIRNSMNDSNSFLVEESDGGFPFVLNQQFKLAIAMTNGCFKFAVNGRYFCLFNYRTHNQLDVLNGFKILAYNGLQINVTSVDHLNTGNPLCDDFETYSHPEVDIF